MSATSPDVDILEGITDKTPKPELKDRLTTAQGIIKNLRDKVTKQESAEQREIEDIKKRVRAKYQSAEGGVIMNVIVGSTDSDFKKAREFLDEFDGILPPALQRLQTGIRVLFDQQERDSK